MEVWSRQAAANHTSVMNDRHTNRHIAARIRQTDRRMHRRTHTPTDRLVAAADKQAHARLCGVLIGK